MMIIKDLVITPSANPSVFASILSYGSVGTKMA